MICTAIQNKTLEGIFSILSGGEVEMAEIRLDLCALTLDEIEELFSTSDVPLVATCRIGEIPAAEAESRLLSAIHAGAAYADLEIEAPAMMSKRLRRESRECGTVLIRSFHDFDGTPALDTLREMTRKCLSLGDIAKIVTTAKTSGDADRVLSLYNEFDPARLLAFSMGAEGRESRVKCLACGAPYSYAALNENDIVASGQIGTAQMRREVYGGKLDILEKWGNASRKGCDAADGGIRMPASKSFAQRAIIAAALSEGTSVLRGYSPCGDSEAAIAVARSLGAKVIVGQEYINGQKQEDNATLTITGVGAKAASLSLDSLHTGESGLLTRLMIPLVSVLCGHGTAITGEGTLLRRPLKGARNIMDAFGIELESIGPHGESAKSSAGAVEKCCADGIQTDDQASRKSVRAADRDDPFIPLKVLGQLQGGNVTISGSGGSQLVSGLLMALPLLKSDTRIRLKNPKSIPYLFITMDVMNAFGVKVKCEMEGDEEFAQTQDWNDCTEIRFSIRGGQQYKAAQMDLEGDWSAAANFLVAGAIFGEANLVGLDTKSLQADLSILDILTDAGASISQSGDNDNRGLVHVQRAPLNAFETDANNCPDLFPIISVLAAFCQGESRIAGVGRLANKESDRGKAILSMLLQLGVEARIDGDQLIIKGEGLSARCLGGKLLHGGNFTSSHDHRMVMALKVAELGADGPVNIDDTECVAKSFPAFLERFAV